MSTFHELQELIDKRNRIVGEGRTILEDAKKAKRELTEDEQKNFERAIDDAQKLQDDIDRRQKLAALELASQAEGARPVETGTEKKAVTPEEQKERREALKAKQFSAWLRSGAAGAELALSAEEAKEARALSAGLDTEGGYTYADEQFVNRLIKAVDDRVYLLGWATKFPVNGTDSLGFPSLDADPADADWTTELQTGSEDSTMAFGKRVLRPNPLAKRIKVSKTLIQRSAGVESLVINRLAYKFGITVEKGLLTGSGSAQPLGVFTASADGIPTSRDISTDNTGTAFTADGLINAKYALKEPYRSNAKWLFHRDGVKMAAKLKDGEGQYLWQPGIQAGQPDRLLNLPVFDSEYVPNTFTSGLYVGILGDFSFLWVAQSMGIAFQRLVELYAETNQIGFIGRLEMDASPVLGEAFARVKLG